MKYFIAIDLGTTGCRSMVFDESFRLLGSQYEEYGLIALQADWYEQDANLWWELSVSTMIAAMEKAKIDKKDVRSISISSQGISIVPVDENLTPLRTALSWMDSRAQDETEMLRSVWGDTAAFTLTGKHLLACYSLPKILWIKNNQPEIWAKTHKMLMPLDFLTAKLTGAVVTDPSMASGTLLYDIKGGVWHKETLDRFGIPQDMLAEIRPAGTSAGTLLPEAAARLGLPADCVVALGAQDQRCAALGAGLAPGTLTVSLGTAAAVCKLWDVCDTVGNTVVGWSPYVFPGTFVTEGVVGTAGAALRWLRDLMYPGIGYDVIDKEAAEARARGTDVIFHPYLSGDSFPRYNVPAVGCFYGLSLASVRGDCANAVMEGVAFQIAEILGNMDPAGEVKKLILFGGGAKSKLWQQIFADATGMEIIVPKMAEAAGVGAAMLAGVGSGDFALDALPVLPLADSTCPGPLHEATRARYDRYLKLEDDLAKGAIN